MVNPENLQNANRIYNQILVNIKTDPEQIRVLDVCCGVYSDGINYDQTGNVYEPVVAEFLSAQGLQVTGVDFRKSIKSVQYNHISSINVLDQNWKSAFNYKFKVVTFLRSWDTPEILLYFQEKTGISDINVLTLEIAKYFLPSFTEILENNGLLFITDVFREDLSTDEKVLGALKSEFDQLLQNLCLKLLNNKNGLWCFSLAKN